MTSSTTLWYATRGSGAVALLLLTASVALGILTSLRVRRERWPRFAIGTLHRNLTLLSIAFVVLHVVTTVADGYAPIGLKDALVPFASPYRPIWLGLGTVAFDLVLALVATSYLRRRIGARTWRGVHWLAYASWPTALVHALGTGSDAKTGWLIALGVAACAAVVVSTLARIALGGGRSVVRVAGAVATLVLPGAVGVWYLTGPANDGWAARAGTPAKLIASHRIVRQRRVVLTSAPSPPQAFTSRARGTIRQSTNADGTAKVVVLLRLDASPHAALRIDLRGAPVDGGVEMSASGVSFVPATTRAVYLGSVVGLNGSLVAANVRDAAGDRLQLAVSLHLDVASGSATGVVRARARNGGDEG